MQNKTSKVEWLFLDLNSYFASVEQQDNPSLRGKAVAVVPLDSDHTCAIAASYEAKAFGIKTGTIIHEAKQLCPHLICVPARHDIYVAYHHRIMAEIVRHTPITKIASIDEMASRLLPLRQDLNKATALANQIKAGIHRNVGEHIHCSIGLASNAWLAKVATDMEKPNGLVALPQDSLPGRLFDLKLSDLPGIGYNMEKRLNRAGLWSVEQLWHTAPKQLRHVWRSVEGEKMWYRLRGLDVPDQDTNTSVIGHSRVLDPALRHPDKSLEVARRLTLKACQRLRRKGYYAKGFSLSVRSSVYGEKGESWARDVRLHHADDNITFMRVLHKLWAQMLLEVRPQRLKKLAITLHDLSAKAVTSGDLFDHAHMNTQAEDLALSHSMDNLNARFGPNTVHFGNQPTSQAGFMGTKIAFNRIPDPAEFNE